MEPGSACPPPVSYTHLADETVTAAEQYSEKIAARIRLTEIISALDILLLIFLIVQQQIQHIKAVRENHILDVYKRQIPY